MNRNRIIYPAAAGLVLIIIIEVALAGLDVPARRALEVFALAIVGWSMTSLDDTFIALAAAVAMALLVIGSPDRLFAALGDSLVWLLVAAFMLGAALKATRVADALVCRLIGQGRSLHAMFHGLTAVMLASAFLIPTTAGRAAMMLPVFTAIAPALPSTRVRVAFALLFPTVILLSAFASLVGAGAHIAAVQLLAQATGESVTFAQWMLLGLPLGAASSFLAAEVILRMFVTADERGIAIVLPGGRAHVPPVVNRTAVCVVALVIAGWLTAPLHGLNETLVALAGAIVMTAPGVGVIRFKDALKEVDWNLLVFLAASIALAQGLVAAEVGEQLLDGSLGTLGEAGRPPLFYAAVVAIAGICLHLVVHSRTARVVVLVPLVLLVAGEAGLDPLSMTLIAVAATGFSQTLLVSAKPVIMFGGIEGATYTQRDLLRLAAVLAPVHLALLLLFAGLVWPAFGVGLGDD